MAVVTGWTLNQPVAAADSSTDTTGDATLLEQMAKLAGDDAAARKQVLFDLAKSGDSRLEAFLENYSTVAASTSGTGRLSSARRRRRTRTSTNWPR